MAGLDERGSDVVDDGVAEDAIAARLRAAGCVFAEDEARLLADEATSAAQLEGWVERRVAGEPLEYIVGWAEFCGLRIAVEPGVFVPRQRTEILVREAVARAGVRPVVVDMCCGSGAIAAAISAALPGAEIHAADSDPTAVACARRNLAGRGAAAVGDLFEALPVSLRGRVTLLVANAPYVPTGEIASMPVEAREHEPRAALDGGEDGTALHRRIASAAPRWLTPGGYLFIEAGRAQASTTVRHMEEYGLATRVVTDDEYGATVVVGRRPAGA